jgi:hypothetical protein
VRIRLGRGKSQWNSAPSVGFLGVDKCDPGHHSLPGASNQDNEMTPGRCSFLRALHDYFRSLSGPVPHQTLS